MAKPAKKTPAPVPQTKADLAARFKDFPALDVLERRMLDPRDPGSLPILLKDDPDPCCGDIGHAFKAKPGAEKCPTCKIPFRRWYIRWGNLGEQERWATLRSRGYVKVLVKELRDVDDVAGLEGAGGEDLVRRGDKGQEVLVKQPFAYFIEIKREKERQAKARQTKTAIKKSIVAQADHDLGDEAAQTLQDHLHIEDVTRHKTTLGEELGVGQE